MFILIRAWEGLIDTYSKASVYTTEEEAHQAMVNEIRLEVLGDDPETTFREDNDGCTYGAYEIDARSGYIWGGNWCWVILEV